MQPTIRSTSLLVLVTGLPGTGKTTFAGALAQALGAIHFNSDGIRETLHLRGHYDEDTKKRVYEQLEKTTASALLKGEKVVVDATFYKKQLRESYRELADQTGSYFFIIELQADEQVIRQRVSKQRPLTDADFSVYMDIKRIYEPITEPHLIIRSDENELDKMVEKTLEWISRETNLTFDRKVEQT